MLKLTTDKHGASHGLSATAELLVYLIPMFSPHTMNYRTSRNSKISSW